MPTSLDLVTVAATDFRAALAFYEAALGALGWHRIVELVDEEEDEAPTEAAAWGGADEQARIWLVAGASTMHLHVRLRTDSRVEVEAFYTAAVAAGGRPHAAPRRWPIYRAGEFNAIVRDPDGNLVEAVAPE